MKVWKKHQNTVYWVEINLAQKKGLKFYQTRSNAIILYPTLPAYCVQKVVRMETGELNFEKVYASLRPPPKISFTDNWMKELVQKLLYKLKSPNQSNQIQVILERETRCLLRRSAPFK